MNKTIIRCSYSKDDLFELVACWAADHNYDLKNKEKNMRLYKNGSYWSFNAHTTLLIKRDATEVTLEVWINPIWGGKMDIIPNGIVGIAPKLQTKKQINELLGLLGKKTL